MKFVLTLFGIASVIASTQAGLASLIPSTTLLRVPSLDTAVVHSERVGPNFAYSTIEGQAYHAITPAVIRTAFTPVQVRYQLNAVPLALAPQYVLQHPILSQLAPAQAVEISAAQQNVPNDSNGNEVRQDSQIRQEGSANDDSKNDDDSITVEAAA